MRIQSQDIEKQRETQRQSKDRGSGPDEPTQPHDRPPPQPHDTPAGSDRDNGDRARER